MTAPRLSLLGDSAVTISLGDSISEEIHARVRALCARLDAKPPVGMVEYVPAYTTVTVFFDPLHRAATRTAIASLVDDLDSVSTATPRTVDIPVCYGGDLGPDLEMVAEQAKLSPDEVVAIHTAGDYLVYMIGFAPGFPYLGGMDPRIAAPRRAAPRLTVPVGTVGIAGTQTGVYPLATPGGWQLIGRTPLALFRPLEDPPTLLRLGDRVRFRAIDRAEYERAS
jgi:inhibitor of KinA